MDPDLWLIALTAVAALWGAAAGTLLPRPAYRFAVDEDSPWQTTCPAGHPLTGPAHGWLGRARCTTPAPPTATAPTATAPTASPATATPDSTAPARPTPAPPAPTRPTPCTYGPSTPTVALLTALVCATLALATGVRPELGVWLLLAPLGVLLVLIDLKVQRLPDPLTLPFAALALLLLAGAALTPEHAGEWRTAALGALTLGGAYFLLFLIRPLALGFGDVKLAVGLGAALGWYGWGALYVGTFAGAVVGSVWTVVHAVRGRAARRQLVALGPFMIAGAYLGLLLEAYAA
ncbi:prepilin peptidase [Streptomyces sp. MA5143a]|uniref:prepilin peptidase n=1 Tax=Streptomyces sp. MA5143a TaxID=2083010 RepID=UPI000D1A2D07|nr:A24 family peptidase [Streptomyces sp. MA5143a]SPF06607.1 Flp pilus assembly protein, protease CpaA [Streptomyces sp. MA5143a]